MATFPKRKLMMAGATLRESTLIRQMAWRTIQNFDRPMTKEEREVYGERGKKLVVYIACINDALLDLEDELESVGKFRHDVKRRVKQAQEIAMKAHETMYKALDHIENSNAGKWYNERYETSANEIRENVFLDAPDKAYSTTMALLRLVKKLNDSLGRFVNRPSESLEAIEKLIKDIPATDRHIDGLIDNHIKYN
jgi:hypothetical protein